MSKALRKPLLVFLILCGSLSVFSQHNLSLTEAKTTIDSLISKLNTYHPYAYIRNGNLALERFGESLKEELPSLLTGDSIHTSKLIYHASRVNALLGDGHFQLTPKRAKNHVEIEKKHYFNLLTTRLVTGEIVITDSTIVGDSVDIKPGTQVLKIEDWAVDDLVEELSGGVGVDDHDYAPARSYIPSRVPLTFYQRRYGYKDSISITLKTEQGISQYWIKPSPKAAAAKMSKERAKLTMLMPQPTKLNNVYKIDVPRFRSYAYNGANPYKQLEKCFKKLEELNAKAIILDLRNNTGGSLAMTSQLFYHTAQKPFMVLDSMYAFHPRARGKGLWQKIGYFLVGNIRKKEDIYVKGGAVDRDKPYKKRIDKNAFKGEVIVLVNEITFSGGTTFATYVQQENRGIVIGQIPGGSAERMYAGDTFKVPIGPKKSILINMPLWYMDMAGNGKGNVKPDIIVPRTLEDVLQDNDAALDEAIRHLSEKLNS